MRLKLICAFIPYLFGHFLGAAVFTVTNADDAGVGTLRDLLRNAQEGDTILIPTTLGPIVLNSPLPVLVSHLTLQGPSPLSRPTIDANAGRTFQLDDPSVTFPSLLNLNMVGGVAGPPLGFRLSALSLDKRLLSVDDLLFIGSADGASGNSASGNDGDVRYAGGGGGGLGAGGFAFTNNLPLTNTAASGTANGGHGGDGVSNNGDLGQQATGGNGGNSSQGSGAGSGQNGAGSAGTFGGGGGGGGGSGCFQTNSGSGGTAGWGAGGGGAGARGCLVPYTNITHAGGATIFKGGKGGNSAVVGTSVDRPCGGGGGGGAAIGGAIFITSGGQATLAATGVGGFISVSGTVNGSTGGAGSQWTGSGGGGAQSGDPGLTFAPAFYLAGSLILSADSAAGPSTSPVSINFSIDSDSSLPDSGVTVTGGGFIQYNNANSYFGATTINGGGGLVIGQAPSANSSTTNLAGGTTLKAVGSFSMPLTLTGSGTAIVDVASGSTLTINSALSGAGINLSTTQSGGTLSLGAGASYSGTTTVQAGKLQTHGVVSGSGIITVGNTSSAELDVEAGSQFTGSPDLALPIANSIFDMSATALTQNIGMITTATLTQIKLGSSGTLLFGGSGSSSIQGTITGTGGTLNFQGSNATLYAAGNTLGVGSTLDMNGSGTFTLDSATPATMSVSNTNLNTGTFHIAGTGSTGATFTGTTSTVSSGATLTVDQGATITGNSLTLLAGSMGTIAGTANNFTTITVQGTLAIPSTGTVNCTTTAVNLSGAKLTVNGLLGSSTLTSVSGTTVQGTGTITGSVNIGGAIHAGGSPGTLTIETGPVSFGASSITMADVSTSASSLIEVIGSASITSGASLQLNIAQGAYGSTPIPLLSTTTGITSGNAVPFNVSGAAPIGYTYAVEFLPAGAAIPTSLDITFTATPLPNIPSGGNASAVANAFICLSKTGQLDGDFLSLYSAVLSLLSNSSSLNDALNQLQPAILTGLAIAQEENESLSVRQAVSDRVFSIFRDTCAQTFDRSLWMTVIGDTLHQKGTQPELGYISFNESSVGIVGGADRRSEKTLLGIAFAYTQDEIKWEKNAGKASIQSGYGGIYSSFFNSRAFGNLSLFGAYNYYQTHRHMAFGNAPATIDRTANGTHPGWEIMGHGDFGFLLNTKPLTCLPFTGIDYFYLHQSAFTETGAMSANLDISEINSDLLRWQIGFHLYRCFIGTLSKWTPDLMLSFVREWRYRGAHYSAGFTGTGCSFGGSGGVTGMNPNRTLFSPAFSLTTYFHNDQISMSIGYSADVGHKFFDQQASFNVNFQY